MLNTLVPIYQTYLSIKTLLLSIDYNRVFDLVNTELIDYFIPN